jgi:hypothetical protein
MWEDKVTHKSHTTLGSSFPKLYALGKCLLGLITLSLDSTVLWKVTMCLDFVHSPFAEQVHHPSGGRAFGLLPG